MHRIEGPYIGLDAQGNPIFKETPLPPTAVPADWLNAIQEEIATLIEYTGLELQTAGTDTWDQLKKSIFNRSPLYTTDLAEALFIRFQNSATEYTSTDGTRFGIDAAGNTEIWNYENTELQIGTNNQDRFKIKVDGTFDFLDGVNTVNLDLSATANVDIGADLAVTADCTIDQDLATTEDVQFERIKLYENAAQTTSVQCQNSISGSAFNDGFYFGMHATGVGHIWNYGATDILFATDGIERFRVKDDGRLSTGAESAPDVDPGGLCLNQGTGDSNILTLKSSDVAHGITNEMETDTYAEFSKFNISQGGLDLWAIGTAETGMRIVSGSSASSLTSTAATGCFYIAANKINAPGFTNFGDDDNLVVIRNFTSTKHIFKGDGDIYTDTGFVGSYDNENDIELAETARFLLAGWDKKILQKNKDRLENLGIIKNGFKSHNKMNALLLGTIGQLWNIVKYLGKELNYSENELLERSKDYS